MEKLYTGKEIASMYGVTPYTVSNYWVKKGLKHIRGSGNSFLYKKEWIEEYIESQIMQTVPVSKKNEFNKIRISRNKNQKLNYVV